EVGYRGGRRLTLRAVAEPLYGGHEGGIELAPGEPVLVTGGARGITAAVALDLAPRWRPTPPLLRTSPPPAPHPGHQLPGPRFRRRGSRPRCPPACAARAGRSARPTSSAPIGRCATSARSGPTCGPSGRRARPSATPAPTSATPGRWPGCWRAGATSSGRPSA